MKEYMKSQPWCLARARSYQSMERQRCSSRRCVRVPRWLPLRSCQLGAWANRKATNCSQRAGFWVPCKKSCPASAAVDLREMEVFGEEKRNLPCREKPLAYTGYVLFCLFFFFFSVAQLITSTLRIWPIKGEIILLIGLSCL